MEVARLLKFDLLRLRKLLSKLLKLSAALGMPPQHIVLSRLPVPRCVSELVAGRLNQVSLSDMQLLVLLGVYELMLLWA